jgi:tetratricopeptide (TPR) repeat protein
MKFSFYILIPFICIGSSIYAQKPISEPLLAEYLASGADAAIKRYAYLKKNEPKSFDFSESQLRDLAFKIYDEKKIADAKKFLLLNTQSFPSSTEAFYYLGFVEYKLGNSQPALTALKKSLGLNANNAFARDLIQAIEKPGDYAKYTYVCPPCFCSQHDLKFKEGGTCIHCAMKLVPKETK